MDVVFADEGLRRMFTHGEGAAAYGDAVLSAFLRRVVLLQAATNEKDLHAHRSLDYRAPKRGARGQKSLHLAPGSRLIIDVVDGEPPLVTIHRITAEVRANAKA